MMLQWPVLGQLHCHEQLQHDSPIAARRVTAGGGGGGGGPHLEAGGQVGVMPQIADFTSNLHSQSDLLHLFPHLLIQCS